MAPHMLMAINTPNTQDSAQEREDKEFQATFFYFLESIS